MKDPKLLSFSEYINEATRNAVYPTDFKGMVQSSLAGIYTSVMAIAQELANEKTARNPSRYNGIIEEVDITRAMNLIFHSEWKKKLKEQALGQMMNNSMGRAAKQDNVIAKKNQKALGRMLGDKEFNVEINKSDVRFSDDTGSGSGSNQ